jgi:chloride channel protein, CIC family
MTFSFFQGRHALISKWRNLYSSKKNSHQATDVTAKTELQEFLSTKQQRRWIFPRAALVGLGAGLVALAFRAALTGADLLRNNFITWAHSLTKIGWFFPILFTLVGAVISVAITRRFAPEASGSGIPHLEAVLHRYRKLNWKRVLPVKFIGGIIAIGSGLALGREGPTVQMGGSIGDAISRLLKVSERERLTLISAGAGAGLSAAFNAPLSGLVFVLEEVRRDFQPIMFGASFLAAVVADIVTRIASGQFPVFSVPSYPTPPLSALPIFAVLGIVTGVLGVVFNKGLVGSLNIFGKIPEKFILPAAAIIGGLVGLVGWFLPDLMGSGHTLAESVLKGKVLLSAIPLFFVIRFFMTNLSYSTGAPGGIFAPLLVLGALLGLGVGIIGHNFFPLAVPIPAVFAVVGMAAYFTAIVRAPLTGIMLIVEMTGNYSQMLPLLVACFCAYVVAEIFKDLPIYEALLERDLQKGGSVSVIHEPAIYEFYVEPEAPFIGKTISTLGLPPGCILVRCSDGKREWVPKANTRLEIHMHLTAVISPEAFDGITVLREGCNSAKKKDLFE